MTSKRRNEATKRAVDLLFKIAQEKAASLGMKVYAYSNKIAFCTQLSILVNRSLYMWTTNKKAGVGPQKSNAGVELTELHFNVGATTILPLHKCTGISQYN